MDIRRDSQLLEEEKITATYTPFTPFYSIIKRLIDIMGALFFLIFFLPLFIIIAVLIKWDDPSGSIFFAQDRVGKNQEKIKMYKFRTMYTNSESQLQELLKLNEVKGAMFKMKDDPRITKVGRHLRKYSLDELPQMFNVLIGNMSLVGPRPPLPREVLLYTSYDKQRLLVKPGITGLWQISGRNALSFQEMVELDLQYIRTLSVWNDIKILLKTVIVVIKSKDAY